MLAYFIVFFISKDNWALLRETRSTYILGIYVRGVASD